MSVALVVGAVLVLLHLVPQRWWRAIHQQGDRLPLRCFNVGLTIQIHQYCKVQLCIGWRSFYWEYWR